VSRQYASLSKSVEKGSLNELLTSGIVPESFEEGKEILVYDIQVRGV
jgi:hypothetical protein